MTQWGEEGGGRGAGLIGCMWRLYANIEVVLWRAPVRTVPGTTNESLGGSGDLRGQREEREELRCDWLSADGTFISIFICIHVSAIKVSPRFKAEREALINSRSA